MVLIISFFLFLGNLMPRNNSHGFSVQNESRIRWSIFEWSKVNRLIMFTAGFNSTLNKQPYRAHAMHKIAGKFNRLHFDLFKSAVASSKWLTSLWARDFDPFFIYSYSFAFLCCTQTQITLLSFLFSRSLLPLAFDVPLEWLNVWSQLSGGQREPGTVNTWNSFQNEIDNHKWWITVKWW